MRFGFLFYHHSTHLFESHMSKQSSSVVIFGTDLGEKSREFHAANITRGWWPQDTNGVTIPRNVGEILCLIHSEIDEALDNGPDEKLPHRRAFEVELADAVIRIYDFLGYQATVLGDAEVFSHARPFLDSMPAILMPLMVTPQPSMAEGLMTVHKSVSTTMEHFRKGQPSAGCRELVTTLKIIEVIGVKSGCDIAAAIDEKHAYNASRADHTLAARARVGGKKW
jgi:hypothetical protein